MMLTASFVAITLMTTHTTITVNPAIQYQTWEGWGTSLCWWANVVGGLPDPDRKSAVKKVFKDLGFTIARFNIGGGENPEHRHLPKRADMPGYLSAEGKWNWDADANQRWVLLECKKQGVNTFEAFSNSPPYWMTKSQCASGNKDKKENLGPEKYDAFADYLTEVVKQYHDRYKIEFKTLDPMNEPGSYYWGEGGTQEGCQFDIGAHQGDLILKTAEALHKKGLNTQVSASDETNLDTAIRSWDALSSEAKNKVAQINAHSYGSSSQMQLNQRAMVAKKRLWMSEYGDHDGTGMTMARRIVRDIRLMKCTAWIYWLAIENWGNPWGLLFMDFYKDTKLVATKKYYAMAQFSKFIKPESRLIDIDGENCVAALKGRELTIVIVNGGDEADYAIDLHQFGSTGKSARVYRTSQDEDCYRHEELPVKDGTINAGLPSQSITTFIVRATTQ